MSFAKESLAGLPVFFKLQLVLLLSDGEDSRNVLQNSGSSADLVMIQAHRTDLH